MINHSDPSTIPAPTNNFLRWPTWTYTNYYDVYCTNGSTIPGEKNYVIGTIYIVEYLIYLCIYVPSLIVIKRSHLFEHACYKIMFCIGISDCIGGFFYAFLAGIFSIMGANYCDDNFIIILSGHALHGAWGLFCTSAVLLAFNRCLDVFSKRTTDALFGGKRVWFWAIPVLVYGILFSSDYDVPPIYNSVWSCYLFAIDYRDGAPPVNDWFCFLNSCCIIATLIFLYSLLLLGMWRQKNFVENTSLRKVQKKVLLQASVICFSVFVVAFAYACASFIRIPNQLAKFATIALQMCSAIKRPDRANAGYLVVVLLLNATAILVGTTAIVYLTINKTIRKGVMELLGIKKSAVYPTTNDNNYTSRQTSFKQYTVVVI